MSELIIYGPPVLFALLVVGTIAGLVQAYRRDGFRIGLDKPLFRKPAREHRRRALTREALIGAIVIVVALLYGWFADP